MTNVSLPCEPGQTVYLTCYGFVTQARVETVKFEMGVRSSARCFETIDSIGQREVFYGTKWERPSFPPGKPPRQPCGKRRHTGDMELTLFDL